MNQQKIQLTQEGYDKLVAELEKLKTVDRIKNLEDLKDARAQGDLSENADYDAAREQQREIEKKIKELEITLKNAVVITTTTTNLGRKIKFEVLGVNEPDLFGNGEFLLVSSVESNPFAFNLIIMRSRSFCHTFLNQLVCPNHFTRTGLIA